MEEPSVVYRGDEVLDLPPGFRFHPTDEEIITHYLTEKVMNSSFSATAMGEADLNKCEPWDLPQKAKMGEKNQWYFFCQKDRKYPTGTRTNRATESGYWKATGKDKEIFKGKGCLVGMKKTLVFYKGRAPKGTKTNWVMHEFRLEGKFACYHLHKAAKDEWTVCKVFHKNTGIKKTTLPELLRTNSLADDLLDCSSLPPLMDPTYAEIDNPGDNVFKGTTTVSSAKISDQGYYLATKNQLVKQENNWNFPMPINSYIGNTSNHDNFTNPVWNSISMHPHPGVRATNSSFPYRVMNEDQYRQGFMQAGKNSYVPSVTAEAGFCGSDDDAILRAFAANNNISHGLDRQFKVEQFSSNQSRVTLSQDTGLSNDIHTETSSVISKQDMRNHSASNYDNLDRPSVAPMSDLDCLWDEY